MRTIVMLDEQGGKLFARLLDYIVLFCKNTFKKIEDFFLYIFLWKNGNVMYRGCNLMVGNQIMKVQFSMSTQSFLYWSKFCF